MYEWTDPDDGTVYEIVYVVTHGNEGPEHFQWRYKPDSTRRSRRDPAWWKLPPFANQQDMKEIEEHFFGSTAPYDQENDE
jgi:hypothetical protein